MQDREPDWYLSGSNGRHDGVLRGEEVRFEE
jgi:hypothetical protein